MNRLNKPRDVIHVKTSGCYHISTLSRLLLNLPISELFVAGIIPGTLMVLAMMFAAFLVMGRVSGGEPDEASKTADKAEA